MSGRDTPRDAVVHRCPQGADLFLEIRAELVAQAAMTMGSVTDAEDIVQEVWLRWRRHHPTITSARAWLHTVTRNLALDRMRERKHWSDVYPDVTLVVEPHPQLLSPTEGVDEVTAAFRLILTSLSPLERITFVLREGLSWDYPAISRLLARSELAVRQLRHRAKASLHAGRRRFVASTGHVAAVSRAYVDVCAGGDVSTLLGTLAPSVTFVPPGHRRVEGRLLHEVAGIVLHHGPRLMLCHRRADLSWYPDVWDVPGSHLISGEPAAACAIRTARTELGVSAVDPQPLAEVSGDDFSLTLLRISSWEGEPRNAAPTQHDAIGFFTREQASRLHLADRKYMGLFQRIQG
jgi:RNA polymerase sigma factor (sigma-70 family)